MNKRYFLIIIFGYYLSFFIFASTTHAQLLTPACQWVPGYGSEDPCQGAPAANIIKAPDESMCGVKPTGKDVSNTLVCCCPYSVVNQTKPKVELPKFIMPELQIKIPGLTLSPTSTLIKSQSEDGSYRIEVPWIAEYIKAIYNYGLGIVGILAALVLMGGGVLWLISGGDASKNTQAKEMIIGSVTGLTILACSYIILFQVNPELTKLKPISLGAIERQDFEPDVDSSSPLSLDLNGISKILGVTCGKDSVAEIVNKSKGKVTYANYPDRGKTGPNNTVYNDCSGFANFVLKCASNKNSGSYTGDIFKEQSVWDMDLNKLQPGDLVGWAPKNNKDNFGHVIIYLGNGKFGDCHGGDRGRKPGNCISNNISFESVKNYSSKKSDGKLYFKRY